MEHGFRAPQELKGFQKVFLEPGDEQEITITLDERAFSYYNVQKRAWEPASGTYEIRIGASSRDIRLKQRVEVSGDAFPNFEQYPSYISGMVQKVPDGEFEALLGQPMPKAQMEPGERFTINNCLEDAKDTKWGKRFYGPASQNSRRAIWRLFGSCLYGADPNDCHKLPCVDGAGGLCDRGAAQ